MGRHSFYILCIVYSLFHCCIAFSQTVADSIVKKDTTAINTSLAPDTAKKTSNLSSQKATPESHSRVVLEYVKDKVEQGADSTYFNILKITNNNGNEVQGVVRISVPQGWNLISDQETSVSISPGNTEYVPIRVSMNRKSTGGTSYIISANLISNRSLYAGKNQNSVNKACYITIPQERHWDIYPVMRTQYFDRYSEYTPLKLRMSNKGNGIEVVKLEFDIGSSLQMYGALGNKHFTSIELKPHRDTVISFLVKYQPYDQSDLWNRDFRKLNVRITASADTLVKKTSVNFKYLESNYYNLLYDKLTPLTLEVGLQNLLSTSTPNLYLAAYGTILFKNDDELNYNVRFFSIPFMGYSTLDPVDYFWRRSRMLARYKSSRWEVQAGDINSYNSGVMGLMGRGIGGQYDLNTRNTIGGGFTVTMGIPIYSATVFHNILLPRAITLKTSLIAIKDDYNKLSCYAASALFKYPFLPGQYLTLLFAPAIVQHNYDNQTFVDGNGHAVTTTDPGVTRLGFAAQVGYDFIFKKASGSLNVLMATKDYWQYYNGKLNINGNAQYTLNQKYYLVGSSSIYLNDPHTYNRGVLLPQNKFLAGMHRVELAGKMTNKLTLFAGPVVEHFSYSALKINRITGDSVYAHFNSVSPKLSVRCNYKNNLSGFISPYTMVGYTFITSAIDPTIQYNPNTPYTSRSVFFNAKAGVNLIQNNWGVNIFYYYGPYSYNSQSDYYYFGNYSKSVRVMPFFQKYYFNRTLLLSSYNSYFYEVLSNSERIALNARLQFFLGHDWSFYLENNLYLSSNINFEGKKTYSRNYFLSVGIKKSFNIPQPRVKYYNLKVVCFKDINGNKIKDNNEQGLADVVISMDKQAKMDSVTNKTAREPGQFAPAEMVTDNFGQVVYYHIPEGEININVFPLQNLKDVFILNGQKQTMTITHDTTYYIPFVQSYRVIGSIILNRDEYSSDGAISIANIRITATDSIGNSYIALTASDGSFTLYVPQAGEYKVSVNNVFGEKISLQESEYTVSFNGAKEFQVDFIFNEKKRQINVNGTSVSTDTPQEKTSPVLSGAQSSTGQVAQPPKLIIAGKDTLKNVTIVTTGTNVDKNAGNKQPPQQDSSIPVGPGILYRIQLSASSKQIPPSQYAVRFKGIKNITEYSENGVYKYTAGNMKSVAEAQKLKTEVRSKGFKDAFMVPFYKDSRVQY